MAVPGPSPNDGFSSSHVITPSVLFFLDSRGKESKKVEYSTVDEAKAAADIERYRRIQYVKSRDETPLAQPSVLM